MKIAFCFSGQTRDINSTKRSFYKHIVHPLRKNDLYAFVHTPCGSAPPVLGIDPTIIVQEDESSISPPPLQTTHLVASRPWHAGDSYRAFYLQVRSIAESIKLQETYAHTNNTKFDWVFRLRFDSLYYGSNIEDLASLSKDAIYIPRHDNWGGLNDRFAFGPPELMRIYATRYDYFNEFQSLGHTMAPEYFLKWVLEKGSVQVSRTNVTHDLLRYGELWHAHYSINRGDAPPVLSKRQKLSRRLQARLIPQKWRDYMHIRRAFLPF